MKALDFPRRLQKLHLLLTSLIFLIGSSSNALSAESLQNLYSHPAPAPEGVTIFVAEEIVTMSPAAKSATAVAVRDGRIIDVGEQTELLARFKDAKGLVVDETFSNKVITPGLIDPHLHFWLFALVSNAHFITPADWQLPWGDAKGVVGEKAYMEREHYQFVPTAAGHFAERPVE